MLPEYLSFSDKEFFVNHISTYPKIYWPTLDLLLHEELRKGKCPIKPNPPASIGCFGYLSGEYYKYKRAIKDYNERLRIYCMDVDIYNNQREYINNLYKNPWFLTPDSRRPYLSRIIKRAFKADYICHPQKGATENSFNFWLVKYFGKKILTNITVPHIIAHPFVPDFVFYDEHTNLHIDIEIDEPYSLLTGEPTHFDYVKRKNDDWEELNSDDFRNSSFSYDGWITIKFCEEQVINYPQGCCKIISNLLRSLFLDFTYYLPLDDVEDVKLIKSWSILDSINMSNNRHREKYLKSKIDRPDFNIDMDYFLLIRNYKEFLRNKL